MTAELERQLAERVWPERPRMTLVDMAQYWRDKNPFVMEGRVVVRRLGLFGDVDQGIPDGECAVTTLATGPHGTVYGTTAGRRVHLFYYDTRPTGDSIADTGVIEGATEAAPTLVFLGDDTLMGAVRFYDDSLEGGYLFMRRSRGDAMHPYFIPDRPAKRLAVPVPGEGVAAIADDGTGERVIGVSTDSNTVFRYTPPFEPPRNSDEEPREEVLEVLGRIETDAFVTPWLAPDGSGGLWTAAGENLVRIDAASGEASVTDIAIADAERVDRMAMDTETNRLYLGVSPGGALAVADLAQGAVRRLGEATEAPGPIRALTVGHDGRVYGVSGPRGALGLFFEYNPEGDELRQLGTLRASQQRVWTGYEFDAACTGPYGEIVLGESERISHLFVYYPPVRRRG